MAQPTTEDLFFKGRRMLFTDHLEDYAEAHTTVSSPLLQNLEAETRAMSSGIMLSDRCVGRFLKMMANLLQPSLAVDVGTFTGHGALCIAEGLPAHGKVITCEVDPKHAAIAERYFANSGLRDRIELRVAPALETIRSIDQPIGLAFIDGDKAEYWAYYDAIMDRLAPRGLIVVDNTLMLGGVLIPPEEATALHPVFQRLRKVVLDFNKRVQEDPRSENCLLTVSDGLTLISKR